MIIGLIRFTYSNVWEPKPDQMGRLKYSTGILIRKDDKNLIEAIKAEVEKAVTKGIATNKFTAQQAKLPKFKRALRDGDEYYNEQPGPDREAYRGHFFLNASNTNPVGVADRFGRPMFDQSEFYSGCYGYADINFFPFSHQGNLGVGVGLNNVMKKMDGDRLDGRQSAAQAFANVADDPDGESASDAAYGESNAPADLT